jgi:hypothetical protein
MAKRVFISFRFHEIGRRNDLLQFFQANGGPIEATPAYMKQAVPGEGEERDQRVKDLIREQMEGCAGCLFLAGDARDSFWMNYEGGVANQLGIPKAGVRHPDNPGALPKAHSGMQEVEWDPAKLAALVASW